MELLDIGPSGSASGTVENMKKQIIAERSRRGAFIRSEGQKAAMNLRAEGSKQVQRILGMAEQESLRTVSSGKKEATIIEAQAEKTALETVAMVSGGADYLITQHYLSLIHNMIPKVEDRLIYLPYNIKAVSGCLKYLRSTFGSVRPARPVVYSGKKEDTFAELS